MTSVSTSAWRFRNRHSRYIVAFRRPSDIEEYAPISFSKFANRSTRDTRSGIFWLTLQSVSPEGAQHMQAGVDAHKQGQFDVAIKEFRKATESDPNLPEAFLDLGKFAWKPATIQPLSLRSSVRWS